MAPIVDDVPPELLAHTFELGIKTYGIRFLPPLCLVCKRWNDLVVSTPRLWGILTLDISSDPLTVYSQIARAKASPLEVYMSDRNGGKLKGAILQKVVQLARQWVCAEIQTHALRLARWSEMHAGLEQLRLRKGRLITGPDGHLTDGADAFFDVDAPYPKLHSFTAIELEEAWITRFLSPSITSFELVKIYGAHSISSTLDYLSLTTNLQYLRLNTISHRPCKPSDNRVIHLPSLRTLSVSNVSYLKDFLLRLRVPSLHTFTVPEHIQSIQRFWWSTHGNTNLYVDSSMSLVFSQWSQPDCLPTHLHTLNLSNCLQKTDLPYLIRWLARLPSLVRLILRDPIISFAAQKSDPESDLFSALASPNGARELIGDGGWLCPSLMQLTLDTDTSNVYSSGSCDNAPADGFIAIARARGGSVPPVSVDGKMQMPPTRLRHLEGNLCSDGDLSELDGLVDIVICTCLGCGFRTLAL